MTLTVSWQLLKTEKSLRPTRQKTKAPLLEGPLNNQPSTRSHMSQYWIIYDEPDESYLFSLGIPVNKATKRNEDPSGVQSYVIHNVELTKDTLAAISSYRSVFVGEEQVECVEKATTVCFTAHKANVWIHHTQEGNLLPSAFKEPKETFEQCAIRAVEQATCGIACPKLGSLVKIAEVKSKTGTEHVFAIYDCGIAGHDQGGYTFPKDEKGSFIAPRCLQAFRKMPDCFYASKHMRLVLEAAVAGPEMLKYPIIIELV